MRGGRVRVSNATTTTPTIILSCTKQSQNAKHPPFRITLHSLTHIHIFNPNETNKIASKIHAAKEEQQTACVYVVCVYVHSQELRACNSGSLWRNVSRDAQRDFIGESSWFATTKRGWRIAFQNSKSTHHDDSDIGICMNGRTDGRMDTNGSL